MAQLNAGDIIDFTIDGTVITAKIEDASKSDVFLAKVREAMPESSIYHVDQVYEFSRNIL